MKILHVIPSYYPAIQFGGPIQSVHLLNRTLVAQGVTVDVFTTNAGLEQSHRSTEWQWLDGVRIKYFPYSGYVHYNFSPRLWVNLFREVGHYDLVHITAVWNFPVLAAALACRRHRIPYVISPRGTVYPETIALKSAFLKKTYYALFAKGCLASASLIHFTAEDERDKVTRYLGLSHESVVIPNGIGLEDFRERALLAPFSRYYPAIGKSPYLLFLGRISFKKGLNLLIPAFARLVTSQPQFRLVIAGPDEEGYRARLAKTIADLGVSDKVFFPGMLSGDAKLAAYRDAVLFVLPSYSENFGMSVVEAMACNTPVVIADQVGIAADIEAAQAGVIVQTTVESVLAGVQGLLSDPERRRQVARNGQKMTVERYDIRQVAARFAKVYARCVDAGGGRK